MTDFFVNFINPEKRLFVGYLISAALIALIWLRVINKKPLTEIVSGFFSTQVWLSKSALADYKLMVINQFFIKILAPILIGQLALTVFIFENMHLLFSRPSSSIPVWMVMIIFTTVLFVLDDFSRYFLHRLMHRVPILWRFHKAHHSATNLTPLTVLRTHPIEAILFSLRAVIVHSLCLGVCFFFFAESVSLIEIFGSSVFVVIFHSIGSNLRHSHVNLSYWSWLEKILVSPAQHQLHHSASPEHFDKNFGVAFACWDLLHRTHSFSQARQVTYGLSGNANDGNSKQTLSHLLLAPIVATYSLLNHFACLVASMAYTRVGKIISWTRLVRVKQIAR